MENNKKRNMSPLIWNLKSYRGARTNKMVISVCVVPPAPECQFVHPLSGKWEITIYSVVASLISPLSNGTSETLSTGVNPPCSGGFGRLNPRDSGAAAPLSPRARLRLGDGVMDGGGQIHSSNELMNKYM